MKRTLHPDALYSSHTHDAAQRDRGSPDYIPCMENAGERMRRLDPDGSEARALLLAVRSGRLTEPEDRAKALLDLIEPQETNNMSGG